MGGVNSGSSSVEGESPSGRRVHQLPVRRYITLSRPNPSGVLLETSQGVRTFRLQRKAYWEGPALFCLSVSPENSFGQTEQQGATKMREGKDRDSTSLVVLTLIVLTLMWGLLFLAPVYGQKVS